MGLCIGNERWFHRDRAQMVSSASIGNSEVDFQKPFFLAPNSQHCEGLSDDGKMRISHHLE